MVNKENKGQGSSFYYEIIRFPLVTEKSMKLSEENKVIFKVSKFADKNNIKEAVEKIFNVKVVDVNIINQKGKKKVFKGVKGIRADFKKAVVTLEKGQNIDLGAGV